MQIKCNTTNQIYNSPQEVILDNPDITLHNLYYHLREGSGVINGKSFSKVKPLKGYKRHKILCMETLEVFENMSALADNLDVHRSVVVNYFKRGGRTLLGKTYIKLEDNNDEKM